MAGSGSLFTCDIMTILYNGDVNGDFYQGWRDNLAAKAGYLLTLVNMGVTVQSAFLSLETKKTDAWMVVQEGFKDIIPAVN